MVLSVLLNELQLGKHNNSINNNNIKKDNKQQQ